jgi:hypothetical protein
MKTIFLILCCSVCYAQDIHNRKLWNYVVSEATFIGNTKAPSSEPQDSLWLYDIQGTMAVSIPMPPEERVTHVILTRHNFVMLFSTREPQVGRILYRDSTATSITMGVQMERNGLMVMQTWNANLTNFRLYSQVQNPPDFILFSDRKRKY